MNQTDFEIVFNQTMEEIRKLLVVKGGEYAGSTDRLANFKRGAELVGISPLQCLFVYMSKHYDAVSTYVRDDATGLVRPRSEPIAGRLDDLINYAILAKALIKESEDAKKNVVATGDNTLHGNWVYSGSPDSVADFPSIWAGDNPLR